MKSGKGEYQIIENDETFIKERNRASDGQRGSEDFQLSIFLDQREAEQSWLWRRVRPDNLKILMKKR